MSTLRFEPPPHSTPEGIQVGKEFDIVCSFKAEKDGSVCLTKFGDFEVGKDEGESEKSNYSPEAAAMAKMAR